MAAVQEARISLLCTGGIQCAFLRVALLPRDNVSQLNPLLLVDSGEAQDSVFPGLQLLEGWEYRYAWEGLPKGHSQPVAEPKEVFQPDSEDGLRGRLRPGLFTGTLFVSLLLGDEVFGKAEIEVRSRKLSYQHEYQWMLRDISQEVTELLMDRFSASEAFFSIDATRDAMTLYQRFAFLRSLITSEQFQLALSQISRRPHTSWEDTSELVAPGQPCRGNSQFVRQLSRPGARTAWPVGVVDSIPLRLDRHRTEATHDTAPNRFVRFALERWRQVLADIDQALQRESSNPAIARGRREVAQVMSQLEEYLQQELFKDLSPLHRFPADDQILQRREGYREVFRAYLEFELAARLSWRGHDSPYSAGQRDVATLYEYWAFLQLSKVVAHLVGESFDMRPLVEARADLLNVVLQSGQETVLTGTVNRLGRKLVVELCFNRTFHAGASGSWSRPMRPDYSIVIGAAPDEPAPFEPIVLHFDAKYRIDFLKELFGDPDQIANKDAPKGGDAALRGSATRADLLKMHAYRDAVRRSAGAYVLYPGDETSASESRFKEYQELLPGLGAFALRPTREGAAIGTGALREFLGHVLDHVAARLTRHERGRYWVEEAYGAYDAVAAKPERAGIDPGPESPVLLGFVKSAAHWDWICQTKFYNVRAEGRPGGLKASDQLLQSQLLLLYCPESGLVALTRIISQPQLVNASGMSAAKYPQPTGEYLCVQLSWLPSLQERARMAALQIARLVERLGRRRGEPTLVRWKDVAELIAR